MKFEEIQKITWNIADVIRDEGSGETTDYMKIGLPLIFLKRVLDIRQEYIEKELKNTFVYEQENDLLKVLDFDGRKMKIYLTNPKEWYFITWDDIVNFKNNPTSEMRTIKLEHYPYEITTQAEDIMKFIEEVIRSFQHEKMQEIFEESDFVRRIHNPKVIKVATFNKLLGILANEDFSFENAPADLFSDAYMDLVEKFAEGAGKKGGEFFTPKSLCEGVVSLLSPTLPERGQVKVCDLTSGSATFVTVFLEYLRDLLVKEKNITMGDAIREVNKRVEIYLQEKTAFTLIMGEMNLILMGINTVEGYNANSITEYINNIGQHRNTMDYFVGNPPYGLKDYGMDYIVKDKNGLGAEKRWELGIPKKGEGEFAFMNTFMDMLNINGRGALVLPLGTLFKDSTKLLRKEYIERDWIEGLVLLPDSMFTTTGIPVVVWFFNKNKADEDKNKIFMVNASESFEKEGKFKVWKKEESEKVYINREEVDGFSGYVSLDMIRDNDYNLSVQRYIFEEIPEEDIDIEALLEETSQLEDSITSKKAEMDDVFKQIVSLKRG